VRGESERGEEEERVGEVEAEIDGAGGRAVVGGMAEEDEERAEEGFIEGEDENGDGEGAGEMAARDGGEGPEEKGEDAEKVDAAGGAVGEFDEGGDPGMVLHEGAVAERPMIAAASAGAGGADCGTPDDDGNIVSEHAPGEASQGCRRAGGGSGSGGGCDHTRGPKLNFSLRGHRESA
jgi:hypothetical protein